MTSSAGALAHILAAGVLVGPGILTAGLAEALIDAVRLDDRAAVASLLTQGADVNAREADGATALAWAAMRSNTGIAELLLDAGANPDLTNALGAGPLSLAIQNGSAAMVHLLLENGADPNVPRENGETPLMTAARMGQADVMKLLLDRGAEVNEREKKFGQTALMWAAGYPAAVRLLVAGGADIRVTTRTWDVKYTIYAPATLTLGKTGIPWNTDGEYISKQGGQNALFFAVQKRDLESARVLVDAGLDIDSEAADGTTPLLASLYKWVPRGQAFVPGKTGPARAGSSQEFGADLAMARFLLDLGASAAAADGAGYTSLHGAALAVAKSARSGEKGQAGGYRLTPALLSLGRTEDEAPPFGPDEALQVVRRLLEAGANPNQQTLYPTPGPAGDVRINPTAPGSSALHIAADSNSVELVKMLADWGADPNLVRKDGHTPFSVAVVAGDFPVVEEMAARGADLSARFDPDDKIPDPIEAITLSRQGQTIMHIAAACLAPDIIESLYSRGAPIDWKNDQGETPLDLADHQERFREALERQRADGDPDRLRAVVRPTETTDAIKKLFAQRAGQAPLGASAVPK